MELYQIKYMLRVAEYRSFSKAAQTLSITQPTLTQQIGKLEAELGILLFRRTTRSVSLTNAGQDFVAYASKVLDAVENLKDVMRSYRTSMYGHIRIGVMPSNALFNLTRNISDFSIANDNLTVEVNQASSMELAIELLDHKTDVAYIDPQKLNLHLKRYLDCQPLHEEPLRLLLPEGHRLAGAGSVSIKELQGMGFLAFESFEAITDILAQLFRENGMEYRVLEQYFQVEELINAVSADRGIAFLPNSLYEKYHPAKTCSASFSPAVKCSMAQVLAKERVHSLPLTEFADFMMKRYCARQEG